MYTGSFVPILRWKSGRSQTPSTPCSRLRPVEDILASNSQNIVNREYIWAPGYTVPLVDCYHCAYSTRHSDVLLFLCLVLSWWICVAFFTVFSSFCSSRSQWHHGRSHTLTDERNIGRIDCRWLWNHLPLLKMKELRVKEKGESKEEDAATDLSVKRLS